MHTLNHFLNHLDDLLKLNAIKFYYKLKNMQLPPYFNSFTLVHQNSIHDYPTRRGNLIRTNPTRTNFAQKCLHNALPSILNSIPPELYNRIYTHSLPCVAQLFKQDFLDRYSNECRIFNCYICRRTI